MLRIITLLTLSAAVAFAAPDVRVHRAMPDGRGWDTFRSRETRSILDEDSLHLYDAVKISPHLQFDLANTELWGYVEISATSHEVALDRIDLRFTHTLTIDSVWSDDAHSATWTAGGSDSLQIWLTPPLAVGDTLPVNIAYHGNPAPIDDWGGFRWAAASGWRPEIAFSMGDGLELEPPPANYNWIPSFADPTDKVMWEAWFRIPSNRAVSTAGLRVDTVGHDDGTTTWHYRLDHPVSTYLLFIAVSDYVIMTQREENPLIENFVYPSRVNAATVHFENAPAILDGFANLFGPYPFDRFGFCMTRIGDMEHATCVSHLDATVGSNHTYDWLLYHEMSHQWWGDWVTCGDWRDLWLNEGFATYCEALSMEIEHGREAYDSYIQSDIFGPALATPENFPIYDPDYYWGTTVYEKGGSVMHMLRMLLGDSAFFDAWREYGQEHAFGNAVTSDWQSKLEQHYGSSLDWFFQEWIYGSGYPRYNATVIVSDIYELEIQQQFPYFTMPVDFRMYETNADDSTEFTIWVPATASMTLRIDSLLGDVDHVSRFVVDPHGKILNRATTSIIVAADNPEIVFPRDFRITSVFPNPFNAQTRVNFDLPRNSPVTLRVFDIAGREVMTRGLGTLSAGTHTMNWDGSNVASGLYLFRIEIPNDNRTAKAVLLK